MSQGEISITGEPLSDARCRFTVDRPVYPDKSFAFLSKEVAKGSPLAERLFEIDGVSRVVISHDQVTVNKSAGGLAGHRKGYRCRDSGPLGHW